MKCKHGIEITGRLKARCKNCALIDFNECRTIRKCTYNTTGLHCLFCNIKYISACIEKHDAFKTVLTNMAFGC
jgi:hypothetical protein